MDEGRKEGVNEDVCGWTNEWTNKSLDVKFTITLILKRKREVKVYTQVMSLNELDYVCNNEI